MGLDPQLIDEGSEVIAAALADGAPHTRAELGAALVEAPASGRRHASSCTSS